MHQPNAKSKQRVVKKIPQQVIKDAVGLAIFTTMRTGLWFSGAGGSGVIVARQEDGSWSPPSGLMLHTAGLGFLVGVDIYDCVLVINNRKALESFCSIRCTLGGEISAVAGPVGVGGLIENDGKWKEANRPVFTYLKSRGFYAGVQVDGTILIERTDENERFYGERIGVTDILAGKARHPPYEIKLLMETLKSAQGDSDADEDLLAKLDVQPTPGDVELSSPATDSSPMFGVPEVDDPDPFGVRALEEIGLEIREAGTHSRVPSSQFNFNPSPTSPIYGKFHRRDRGSIDTTSSWNGRESYMSHRTRASTVSFDRTTQTDAGTQTNGLPATQTARTEPSSMVSSPLPVSPPEPEEVDYTKIDLGPYSNLAHNTPDFDGTTMNDSPRLQDSNRNSRTSFNESDDDLGDEEPVVFEAASAHATTTMMKPKIGVVTIPARGPPPPLPPRNTARRSKGDTASALSVPLSPVSPISAHEGFETVDLHGSDISARTSLESPLRSSFGKSRGSFSSLSVREPIVESEEEKADIADVRLQRLLSDASERRRLSSIASVDDEAVKLVLQAAEDHERALGMKEDNLKNEAQLQGIIKCEEERSRLTKEQEEAEEEMTSIESPQNYEVATPRPEEYEKAPRWEKDDKEDKEDFHSLPPTPPAEVKVV